MILLSSGEQRVLGGEYLQLVELLSLKQDSLPWDGLRQFELFRRRCITGGITTMSNVHHQSCCSRSEQRRLQHTQLNIPYLWSSDLCGWSSYYSLLSACSQCQGRCGLYQDVPMATGIPGLSIRDGLHDLDTFTPSPLNQAGMA